MPARRRTWTTVLPWLLCAVTVGLLALATALRYLDRADAPAGSGHGAAASIDSLGFLGVPLVGALIASRMPSNPYGWLWCALGLDYAVMDVVAFSGASVVDAWVSTLLVGCGFAAFLALLTLVFLLFPTGRLPSARWLWLARAAVVLPPLVALAVPFTPVDERPGAASPWVLSGATGRDLWLLVEGLVLVLFVLCVLAMASVLLRFRRAGAEERQQLKWFAVAGAVNAIVIVADLVGLDEFLLAEAGEPAWAAVTAVSFGLLPVAVGVAVLRYRLYEIDRIISRTVSYAVLTAVLAGVYVLVVTSLRQLLEPVAGTSQVAVVVSTLVVAAVFQPVRRRVQAGVDARFDRARYDAARAVERYAARLRDQVDLDQVTEGLRETVTGTVGPSRVAVWIRPRSQP